MLNGIQWPMLRLQCYDYDDNNDDDDANRTTSQLHIAVLQSVCDTMLVFCGLIFLSCVDKTRCQELFKYYVGFNGAFCFFSPFFCCCCCSIVRFCIVIGIHCSANICASVTFQTPVECVSLINF